MQVGIKLWGRIAYYLPEARGKFSLKKSFDGEKSVQEVVEELRLPKDLQFIITVNGRVAEGDYVLEDGDEIALFTPSSGG
jgi:molybdopterin converting factor small subunit